MLLGAPVIVRTDHKSLKWLMRTVHADGTRVANWALRLQGRRVAIFSADDDLWYPGMVSHISTEWCRVKFDDPSWPDYEITSVDCPLMLALMNMNAESSRTSRQNIRTETANEIVTATLTAIEASTLFQRWRVAEVTRVGDLGAAIHNCSGQRQFEEQAGTQLAIGAKVNGVVVGAITGVIVESRRERRLDLAQLFVVFDQRRQGVARALLQQACMTARKVQVTTVGFGVGLRENQWMLQFWGRLGFTMEQWIEIDKLEHAVTPFAGTGVEVTLLDDSQHDILEPGAEEPLHGDDAGTSTELDDGLWLSSSASGYRGVRRGSRSHEGTQQPWVAEFFHGGKTIFLGSFATAREAAVAYAAARSSSKAEAASAAISIPRSCVFQNQGDSNWYVMVHAKGLRQYIGHFDTEAEANDAYLNAKRTSLACEAEGDPPRQSCKVVPEHRGLRLHLSHRNLTGYLGVYPHGPEKFRAIHTKKVDGVQRREILGIFDSVVDSAYAYSLHVGPPA